MLSRDSALYEPLSYNNGAVWPFLSGFATLALYSQHRPDAAWQYLDGTADLTFLESRGYMAELFSGDRLRSIDAAVPHQLFATTGFVSGLMRGLVGLREPAADAADAPLSIEPQLPPDWPFLRIRRLRWRDATFDVNIAREARGIEVAVSNSGRPRPLVVKLALPPGAEVEGNVRELRFSGAAAETRRVRVRPGIEIAPVHPPLALGDPSQRLRVITTGFDRARYTARLQGRQGRTYRVRLSIPFEISSMEGGTVVGTKDGWKEVDVAFPSSENEWVTQTVVVATGRRASPPAQ